VSIFLNFIKQQQSLDLPRPLSEWPLASHLAVDAPQLIFGRFTKINVALMMPLFGKKESTKKPKKDGKEPDKPPSVEDKYDMKDVLGT